MLFEITEILPSEIGSIPLGAIIFPKTLNGLLFIKLSSIDSLEQLKIRKIAIQYNIRFINKRIRIYKFIKINLKCTYIIDSVFWQKWLTNVNILSVLLGLIVAF